MAPVGPAGGGEIKPAASQPTAAQPTTAQIRAQKMATFRATVASAVGGGEVSKETPALADPAKPAPTLDPAKPAEPAKPEPKVEAKTDDLDAKSLEAIEKRDLRARNQLAADRAAFQKEIEDGRAELARLRAEVTGKTQPLEDLKKLPAAKRAIEAMKLAGLDPDDEETMEVIARDTYARSKSGKADPTNRQYADQLAEKQGVSSELTELRKMIEERDAKDREREQRAKAESFANQYLDEAVKGVKPETFLGRALAANASRARSQMLAIGQHLEKQNGELPSHAEVVAAYEDAAKADLKERGFTDAQIASMLTPSTAAPAAPAKPAAAAPRTLDPAGGKTTAIEPSNPSRDQKIATARAARLKSQVSP